MNIYKTLLPSDTEIFASIPVQHPIFKSFNGEYNEKRLLAYVNGLARGNLLFFTPDVKGAKAVARELLRNQNIYVALGSEDIEFFKKILAVLRPSIPLSLRKRLGLIRRYSPLLVEANTTVNSITLSEGCVYVIYCPPQRTFCLWKDTGNITAQDWCSISYQLANRFPRRCYLNFSLEGFDRMDRSVARYRELRSIAQDVLRQTADRIIDKAGFITLSNLLGAGQESGFFNIEMLTILALWFEENSHWKFRINFYDNGNRDLSFKYNDFIEAPLIYKRSENSETGLRFPYFLYDFEVRAGLGGYLTGGVWARGYHPNRFRGDGQMDYKSNPHLYIDVLNKCCTGELETRITETDLADLTKQPNGKERLFALLRDVVMMYKTVNLSSALWQPSDDRFLETVQKFIASKAPKQPVEVSADEEERIDDGGRVGMIVARRIDVAGRLAEIYRLFTLLGYNWDEPSRQTLRIYIEDALASGEVRHLHEYCAGEIAGYDRIREEIHRIITIL